MKDINNETIDKDFQLLEKQIKDIIRNASHDLRLTIRLFGPTLYKERDVIYYSIKTIDKIDYFSEELLKEYNELDEKIYSLVEKFAKKYNLIIVFNKIDINKYPIVK